MELKINSQSYQVAITKKDIKHLYIRIKDNNIISVTCAKRFNDKMIAQYLDQNSDAIKKMIDNHLQQTEKASRFYYLGKPYQVIYNSSLRNVIMENNSIYVNNEMALNKWLTNQIKIISEERFNYWLKIINPPISKPTLKFRSMTSRWGVCHRHHKSVTLNTKLIRYSMVVIDYVIIHELCHFKYPHHQITFWQDVSKYCPDYKNIRKMLKE